MLYLHAVINHFSVRVGFNITLNASRWTRRPYLLQIYYILMSCYGHYNLVNLG